MTGEWKEKSLLKLAILHNDSWKVGDEKCPYIALEHIEEGKLRLNGVGHSDIVTSNKYRFRENNFLFGKLRPYFRKVVLPRFSGICSTDIWVIGARDGTDLTFLFYLFANPEFVNLAYSGSSGTRMPRADWNFMKDTEWLVPSDIEEQRAIASVLSSLDDKIDLLHRQNKTLEAMAETLFRQWFVEEADEEWETGKLGDIADINPPYKLKKGDVSSYLDMKNLNTSTFNPEGWCKREFSSGMKFKNGDTLLARITPCLENGKTCYVDFLDEDEIGWGSTEYIVIRMKKPFHPFISYILAKDKDFRDFAISSMSGSSGRQRAQAGLIKEYGAKIPPLEIIEKLNLQLTGIVPKLEKNARQIRTLEKLRDTLLPKLMSGEVRVEYE